MATVVVGGALVSVDIVLKALGGLVLYAFGRLFIGKLKEAIEKHIEKIKEHIQELDIDGYIQDHVMTKKHEFNDECGEDCILYVAFRVKNKINWVNNGSVPYIRGSDYCRHGCDIEVRMSLPPGKHEWKIGTAFHKYTCNCL